LAALRLVDRRVSVVFFNRTREWRGAARRAWIRRRGLMFINADAEHEPRKVDR